MVTLAPPLGGEQMARAGLPLPGPSTCVHGADREVRWSARKPAR
jgi:hypothetical protein